MEQLDRLLEDIEENIDFEQCLEIDQRYARALNYEAVDRPPLTIECQQYAMALGPISYQEAFEDPAKMMYNELLVRVKFCMETCDDGAKALRSDHGTVVVSSMLGGNWKIRTDMWPWVEPFRDLDKIREIVDKGVPEINAGLAGRVYEFMQFYNEKLNDYPKCKQAIQIAKPDPQGPFDVAELLCGSGIFLHLYDEPELIGNLLSLVAKTTVAYYKHLKPVSVDRSSPELTCQHGYMIPGEILIRNDSIINVSPQVYKDLVQKHDEYVLTELGGGSIHFCGDGSHQIDVLLETKGLLGLDFGQTYMMDIDAIYAKCASRKIPIMNITVTPEQLISGEAAAKYPTGAVLSCQAETVEQAKEIMTKYKNAGS
ncbi:hypothetical protein ACFL3G_08365 [Planctomycetota bacterium]